MSGGNGESRQPNARTIGSWNGTIPSTSQTYFHLGVDALEVRQHASERTGEDVCVFLGEHQWRSDLEHVFLRSGGPDQDPSLSHGIDDAVCHIGGLFSTDFDPGELATSPYVADYRMIDGSDRSAQISTDLFGSLR